MNITKTADMPCDDLYSLCEKRQRIINEWLDLWTPIDDLVRPYTPLGESVRDKAVELIKKGLSCE